MQKIVYIAGLGHSGSTVLDMSLGANPKIVGLGEVGAMLLKKDKNRLFEKSTCSCGEKGSDCDFWKNARNIIEKNTSINERYELLIQHFNHQYKNEKIFLDSSKNSYEYLDYLNKNFNLKVVFLTRDFRSWAFSRKSRKAKPIFFWYWWWFLENQKLLYVLKKYKIQPFFVGYEEFALYPELMFRKILDFLEIDFNENMLIPAKTQSHIINGNIARTDSKKKQAIKYDFRWLSSWKINFWRANPLIFRLNKKLVYSNLTGKQFHLFDHKRIDEHVKKYDS